MKKIKYRVEAIRVTIPQSLIKAQVWSEETRGSLQSSNKWNAS